ncbi:hypothetical protein CKA32_003059 [Geitlerinema sp. FC II]|nr:hypothetical protein CKA32_003059 [Geitlerinema sp. FC II]
MRSPIPSASQTRFVSRPAHTSTVYEFMLTKLYRSRHRTFPGLNFANWSDRADDKSKSRPLH